MDVIDAFIGRYVKEYDFYDQAARLVRERLENSLRASGVRCLVTSRAKDISRLEEKCRRRNLERDYVSADDIFDDIADLAGVRVALYFPGERDQVDGAITKLFRLLEDPKEFPESTNNGAGKRFSGYSASHYRIQLREDELSQSDRRYSNAKVEIQVASVLMHAWSEVEHDLVYKPLEGDLSEDEYSILDQLNGMVIAGEIALETLQRAGKRRVAESGNRFSNHYELAAYLLSRVDPIMDEPVDDVGLGRVDILFTLLRRVNIDTPGLLAPYLDALHGNLEIRPLAEQVIDTLLAEDDSRYEVYRTVQDEAARHNSRRKLEDQDVYRQVGLFLTTWGELDHLVRDVVSYQDKPGRATPIYRLLDQVPSMEPHMRQDVDLLRRLRNDVVHQNNLPPADYLAEATARLASIIEEIRRRNRSEGE